MKEWFYRAMPLSISQIDDGNYITMSKRFAIDHAITSSIYYGEDYGVYRFLLKNNEFRPANNPGEFLYLGPSKNAYLYGIAEYDDFSSNSTFKISKNKLRDLYSWLNLTGFTKESEELKLLIAKI